MEVQNCVVSSYGSPERGSAVIPPSGDGSYDYVKHEPSDLRLEPILFDRKDLFNLVAEVLREQ